MSSSFFMLQWGGHIIEIQKDFKNLRNVKI